MVREYFQDPCVLAVPLLTARGESRLAQKPGQPPYFAHREASIESTRLYGEIW